MKNIYLLPTDKPSRLHITGSKLGLYPNGLIANPRGLCKNQHIYITNNEKPKKDYFLSLNDDESYLEVTLNNEVDNFDDYADKDWTKHCKKIILTDDTDLIKDGVQAIDDEFLEWFVKNSSCEEVEILDYLDDDGNIAYGGNKRYQICHYLYDKNIIPQEEPKEVLCGEADKFYRCMTCGAPCGSEGHYIEVSEKAKQETVEEAAKNQWGNVHRAGVLGFIEGAKWQSERSYSKEDVNQIMAAIWLSCKDNEDNDTFIQVRKKILKQFKKK
jgi:hypothetical protein